MLVDTAQLKLSEVNLGGEAFVWVVWSPKETMALLGWRDNLSDKVAVVRTADGKMAGTSKVRTAQHRYMLVRAGSAQWRDEDTYTFEAKFCRATKGQYRNLNCEIGNEVKYRPRVVKLYRRKM